ncbi:MAG: hypothetical protein JSS10_02535 [Verrucomicrobia bacterium]|nr:hypothetical protein [Verrucomicrobiota bacterium]
MKHKRKLAFILIIVGVVLFIFTMYEKGRVSSAKSDIRSGTSMFSGNAVGNMVGGVLQNEAGKYDTTLKFMEMGSIILMIVGAGMFFVFRKTK